MTSFVRRTLLVLFLLGSAAAAQELPAVAPVRLDTIPVIPVAAPDTSITDSTKSKKSPSGVDSVVTYTASDSIIYGISKRTMYMFGKGTIKYKTMGLNAERINVNWNTSVLHAYGIPDTTDTTHTKTLGRPDMIDGAETYHGDTVSYNFKSKKGKIHLGNTEMQKGYYYGDEIKKTGDKEMFIEDGRYTTCEEEHPHYAFYSPKMKLLVGDKVVVKPVILTIHDVPVFALPFGIFPVERGRRSGFIAPAYGESSSRGRYITHLGYYWAMNDYMDLNLRADGYAKGGYALYSSYRYALRYYLRGSLNGSFARTIYGERGDPSYSNSKAFNLNWTHSQDFNPTTKLLVNFTFMSGSYFQQTSTNLNDLLKQNIVSNATLTKSWEGTANSMTMNIHRDQNLLTGEISENLPSISFSRSQTYPFRSSSTTSSGTKKWYEQIGYTYGGQFIDLRNKSYNADSSDYIRTERWGMQHTSTINASPKVGYLTVTPFINLTSKWYGKSIRRYYDNNADTLITDEVKGFKTANYFDMGVSMSTKLYGILRPNMFGITGVRHQLTPSISYTYSPDFSKEKYGYYGTYLDSVGGIHKYSYFEKDPYGGAPSEERQSVSFRLGNVFEMKTEGDSVGKENKYTLVNLDLSTSYNFARDSMKFDAVAMSYRTSIGQWLNIGGSSGFNLYKFQPDSAGALTGHRVNRLLVKDGRLADLTNFSLSVSTRLSGEKKKTSAGPEHSETDSTATQTKKLYTSIYDTEEPDFSIPWSLDLNWNYSQTQSNPKVKYRSSGVSISLGFNLTEYWKFTANANYDIVNSKFAAPQITIYRDLHCWEMNFNWVPTGSYRNFKLEIRLKASQLKDVKVTKQGSASGVYD